MQPDQSDTFSSKSPMRKDNISIASGVEPKRVSLELREAEKTIANKDVIIKMLQEQIKKMEENFKNNLQETERFRFKYCLAAEQINRLRSVCSSKLSVNSAKFPELKAVYEEYTHWQQQLRRCAHFIQSSNESCECSETPPKITNEHQFIKDHYGVIQATLKKIMEQRQKDSDGCICETTSTNNPEFQVLLLKEEVEKLKGQSFNLQQVPREGCTEKCLSIFEPMESTICAASNNKTVSCACGVDQPKAISSEIYKKIDIVNEQIHKLLENEEQICCEICSLKEHVQEIEELREEVRKLQESNADINKVLYLLKNTVATLWEQQQNTKASIQSCAVAKTAATSQISCTCSTEVQTDLSTCKRLILDLVDVAASQISCTCDTRSTELQTELGTCKPLNTDLVNASQTTEPQVEEKTSQTQVETVCEPLQEATSSFKVPTPVATVCEPVQEAPSSLKAICKCDQSCQTEVITVTKSIEVQVTEIIVKPARVTCVCKSMQTVPEAPPVEKRCVCTQASPVMHDISLQIKEELKVDSFYTANICLSGESQRPGRSNAYLPKEHLFDLDKERAEKEKQIAWLNELIAYYISINENLARLGNEPKSDHSVETLRYFIQKVINENNKLKSTVSLVIRHLHCKMRELAPERRERMCNREQNTERTCVEDIKEKMPIFACDKSLDVSPVICVCNGAPSEQLQSTYYHCACAPDIRDIYNEVLCMCMPNNVTRSVGELPAVLSACMMKDYKEMAVCTRSEDLVQTHSLDPENKDCSCESFVEDKMVLGNLSNYLSYLQQQLAIIMEIENQMEDIRVDIRTTNSQ